MTTLPDIRDRIRKDLHDTGEERWTDAQLDRHIARALSDLSLAIPREASAVIATTPGSRDIDVTELDGVVSFETVEYPAGSFPPEYVRFSHWTGGITIHSDGDPDGSDAKVYFTGTHSLDDEGSTLPPALDDILATGAGAYAALEWSSYASDRLNTGGDAVAERYASWGRAALTAFRQLLREHGRKNTVRARRMYTPV